MSKKEPRGSILVLIGLLKLGKAVLLLIFGFTALQLTHSEDIHATIGQWVHDIHVDPENHHIHELLSHLPDVSPATLRELSVGTFIYAALFTIEGLGLVLRRRWAEYVTVVSTSLLLPLEIYEVVRHISPLRVAMLVVNAAVVVYLIYRLQRPLHTTPGTAPDMASALEGGGPSREIPGSTPEAVAGAGGNPGASPTGGGAAAKTSEGVPGEIPGGGRGN